uniref:3 transmembrane helices protein n=1 Tax=Pithovirus LCPAC401 TaxID=2506595 RepID=A0A481ZAU8_9VIRU|nr:MAG: 3 transmembrane helices protein [Pithovirus LCPAC401]
MERELLITYIILIVIVVTIVIVELNRERDEHSEGIVKVKAINRRNWNASTERVSLLSSIISGVILGYILGVTYWFNLLMVILIIFIVVYFTSAWLGSHWYKRTHEQIDKGLIGFKLS